VRILSEGILLKDTDILKDTLSVIRKKLGQSFAALKADDSFLKCG
jgi:hypothetical protein